MENSQHAKLLGLRGGRGRCPSATACATRSRSHLHLHSRSEQAAAQHVKRKLEADLPLGRMQKPDGPEMLRATRRA